jgi:hypothetical protein
MKEAQAGICVRICAERGSKGKPKKLNLLRQLALTVTNADNKNPLPQDHLRWMQWLMPVNPNYLEGRGQVQLRQKVSKTPYQKISWAWWPVISTTQKA